MKNDKKEITRRTFGLIGSGGRLLAVIAKANSLRFKASLARLVVRLVSVGTSESGWAGRHRPGLAQVRIRRHVVTATTDTPTGGFY